MGTKLQLLYLVAKYLIAAHDHLNIELQIDIHRLLNTVLFVQDAKFLVILNVHETGGNLVLRSVYSYLQIF